MLRDLGVLLGPDRLGVEEAAGVVELDLTRRGQRGEGAGDLRGDRPEGSGFGEGVLPEIAHEAAPGALAVGQKESGYRDDLFCG